jgi:hypothetical protein
MAHSFLDRRAALFAVLYSAVGFTIVLAYRAQVVVHYDSWLLYLIWPVAFPLWGHAGGTSVAGEAGGIVGVLLGIALIPIALILLSWLVDRLLPA